MDRAFSPWIYHLWANPGAVPQSGIVRTFGARPGDVQPPGSSKCHISGLFEGQRPGPIPAYGIAIGIRHWHDRRAESPVSCLGYVTGTDGSGLQPSDLSFMGKSWGCTPVWYCAHLWCWGGGRTANGCQRIGIGRSAAPTAQNEKSQATGLGIGHELDPKG